MYQGDLRVIIGGGQTHVITEPGPYDPQFIHYNLQYIAQLPTVRLKKCSSLIISLQRMGFHSMQEYSSHVGCVIGGGSTGVSSRIITVYNLR